MVQLSDYQRDVLIRTALGEARGEGVEGMADVIQVILNRANSGQYPSDPAAVALQPYQFSTWNRGEGGNNPHQFKPTDPIYQTAAQALEAVVSGSRPDYTGGALFYHTPAVNPAWAGDVNRYGTVARNGHIFYPSRPVPPGEIPNVVASQLDTARPARVQGRDGAPANNDITRAFPTRNATPRLAPQADGLYAYAPNMESAHIIGGLGSLTPNFFNRNVPFPRPRPGMPIVPYGQGQTIATVATPQPRRLPELPPSTLSRGPASPADIASVPYGQGTRVGTVPTTGLGRPPSTRVVPSVPIRAAQPGPSDAPGVMPSWAAFQEQFGRPRTSLASIPGPNAAPKDESRLPAGIYPVAPVLPDAVPDLQVASALDVVPAVPGFPPLPQARPLRTGVNVTMPTPMGQRPMLPAPQLARMPVPRAPLRIVVQADPRQAQTKRPFSTAFGRTAASGFGSDINDPYSTSTSISG